ncbi:TIGR03557 family F420-dependent LLM class oxidoreductase [Allorhizocola rhizosphaerae]|uniref:TIGR03557 family F420-dependent LLM class oxidoreductase n=1 Tax=Allorhizocola rhizosphaerae TaxID=1872709 RepID=UPI000E3B89ED|nr:TIGR03557 family F420-dependent LLM class oxidoreductase [Allorhizocola rhizosphaerae]
MAQIGYTLMSEQSSPRQLVDDALGAERAGFDFAVCSDHYYPWLEEQGHSPYAWAVLGAVAHATERMGLMSFVTCPIQRYHPAVVAQKAATVGLLSEGRFILGLGSGENLNEHVSGGWPHRTERHARFAEALEIIHSLLQGDRLTYSGDFYEVPEAYLWDRPTNGVPIGVAVSGPDSCALAGTYADVMIATEPKAELVSEFEAEGGAGKPKYGQVAICYGPDEQRCVRLAHEQFRWFGLGWPVNAELPDPRAFGSASAAVTEEQVAQQITCGPDAKRHIDAITKFIDAGFTHVALVQIGGQTQRDFLDFAERELLPALR